MVYMNSNKDIDMDRLHKQFAFIKEIDADKLFGMLPEDQGRYMRELWDEFEAEETAEARFARSGKLYS